MIIPSRDENLKTVMKQTGRHICPVHTQNMKGKKICTQESKAVETRTLV